MLADHESARGVPIPYSLRQAVAATTVERERIIGELAAAGIYYVTIAC